MTHQPAPPDWYERADVAATYLRDTFGIPGVDALVVLGSGWGPAAGGLGEAIASIPTVQVPHFLAPVAPGHAGTVALHELSGHRLLVFCGRTHLYEGHGAGPVVHSVRTAAALGARVALFTNANGSFRTEWKLGEVAVVTDHLNFAGGSPLVGARFADLTDLYSARLRAHALTIDPHLRQGVYAMFHGPHYETAAEARAAVTLGADLVGMSTVFEAIAARELGLEVMALSTVTANEFAPEAIDPDEVVAIAERSASRYAPLLADVLHYALANDPAPTHNQE